MQDYSNNRFLVTGASSGIGRGIATHLLGLGAEVILVGRNTANLTAAGSSAADEHKYKVESFDLTKVDEIPAWMGELADKHGKLDGVVHSAGILVTKPVRSYRGTDWEGSFLLNVTAGGLLAKGFRQKGVSNDGGSLVYLSSVMGIVGQPGQVVYSATKAAVIGMVRSLAVELARENIRVNAVSPAVVETGMSLELQKNLTESQYEKIKEMHPLGLGKESDIASAVEFLLADSSRWITGSNLVVDGGYTAL